MAQSLLPDTPGWQPLHLASHEGSDEIVEHLIRKHGAQVNGREASESGRTALMLACMRGHKRVIERLLLAGANANMTCQRYGNNALHYVAVLGDEEPDQALDLVELLQPFTQQSLSALNL